jgi:hypothetical protein
LHCGNRALEIARGSQACTGKKVKKLECLLLRVFLSRRFEKPPKVLAF